MLNILIMSRDSYKDTWGQFNIIAILIFFGVIFIMKKIEKYIKLSFGVRENKNLAIAMIWIAILLLFPFFTIYLTILVGK